MYTHPLSPNDLREYRDALIRDHRMRLLVDVLDQNEEPVGSLTAPDSLIVSGSVDIDTDAQQSRRLRLEVLDEAGGLPFDPNSSASGAIFAHRMIRVRRGIYVPAIGDWVDTPVFWGPISAVERQGVLVSLEAVGKEALVQIPHVAWKLETRTFKAGADVVATIQSILEQMGETRFDFPALEKELPRPVSVGRHNEPWTVVKRLAASLNRQLFYDGDGRAKLRMHPENPAWTFHDGIDGTIATWPRTTYSLEQVRNVVEVLGPKPDGKTYKRIRAVAVAAPSNALSPGALARSGVPRFLLDDTTSVDVRMSAPEKDAKAEEKERYREVLVRKQEEAEEIAKRRLRELLRTQVATTFDALPVPDLEEGDVVSIRWDGGHATAHIAQMTIPLAARDLMSVGYLKRPKPGSRKTLYPRRRAG